MCFLVTSCVCCLCLCLSVSVSCCLHCSALPVSLWCVCLPVHVSGALCCGGGASAASRGEELDVLTPALWLRASACVRWRKRHSKCVGFEPKHESLPIQRTLEFKIYTFPESSLFIYSLRKSYPKTWKRSLFTYSCIFQKIYCKYDHVYFWVNWSFWEAVWLSITCCCETI